MPISAKKMKDCSKLFTKKSKIEGVQKEIILKTQLFQKTLKNRQ